MTGTEDTGAAINDWISLISSPRGLFPAFISESFGARSFSQFPSSPPSDTGRENEEGSPAKYSAELDVSEDIFSDWKPMTVRNGGSFAERRSARCGFNAPRINTARFRSVSPLASPAIRSPYLTIPPGLSPTTLLDSPVMLSNAQAQPSPTTGTFRLPSFSHESPMQMTVVSDTDKDESLTVDSSSFIFKPHGEPMSMPILPSGEKKVSSTSNQAQHFGITEVNHHPLAQVHLQMGFECEKGYLKQTTANKYCSDSLSKIDGYSNLIETTKHLAPQSCHAGVIDQGTRQREDPPAPAEGVGSKLLLEEDEKGAFPSTSMGRPSEDGYNWRKYGQKQVKGSEYPRSYYKCTHQNCQVKKKVERSHDGQITEIIYKGAHNHPKPQPNRRSAIGSSFSVGEMSESQEGQGQFVRAEGGSIWRSQGYEDKGNGDWKSDGFGRTSSASVVTEVSDPSSTAQGKQMSVFESADTPEFSSTLASHDDDEDGPAHGSMSLGDDGEDDESESKRRKKESCLVETNLVSRSVREPRVVVQTDSDVDILDDGYRWRKYGQKVVKGNPNPRSYYKCTNAGCTVRKHVERASHDLKSVITTYEGKHNHEVPAARNSNHLNLGSGNSRTPSNSQTTVTLSVPFNISKPEPQFQDLAPRFERNPELSNDYLKPGYMGRFSGDIKLGAPSCYGMTSMPPFPQSISLGPFSRSEALQAASIAQAVPDFPLSFPSMGLPQLTNLPLVGFDFNHGFSHPFSGQWPKENDLRFLGPKQEQKDEGVYGSQLPMANLGNASCPQLMGLGGFPL